MPHLRSYQEQCVELMLQDLEHPGNSILVLGTAAGKSHIIAEFAKRLNKPCLILCDTPEILVQNREKMRLADPTIEIGTYAATLKEKTRGLVNFGMIQSVARNPSFFQDIEYVIIDECHRVPHRDKKSQYLKTLAIMSIKKLFGLTATPYRLEKRNIHKGFDYQKRRPITERQVVFDVLGRSPEVFWQRILVSIDQRQLVAGGYTVPLLPIAKPGPSRSILRLSGADFDTDYAARKFQQFESSYFALLSNLQRTHRSILVFCSTVEQAERFSNLTPSAAYIEADTDPMVRKQTIEAFQKRELQVLYNVQCLTTGFDAPSIDCIILIRPTNSLALYTQMLGRGVRLFPEKRHCLVYDFAGNTDHFGSIEDVLIDPAKATVTTRSEQDLHGKVVSTFTSK